VASVRSLILRVWNAYVRLVMDGEWIQLKRGARDESIDQGVEGARPIGKNVDTKRP
jgi:hypothetical protein